MSNATLIDDVRGSGRAVRMYELSVPKAFRGLGMKTSRVMVSVAQTPDSDVEVAVLPVARDGHPISFRQAIMRTSAIHDALEGGLDMAVLEMAGIALQGEEAAN